MAGEKKIDYGAMAAARLAGQSREEQASLQSEGKLDLASPPSAEDEDYLHVPNRRSDPDDGWTRKGTDRDGRFFDKLKKKYANEGAKKSEAKEAGEWLPNAKECEILKEHQHYQWFREGTRIHFLDRTKDTGISEAERLAIFEQNCQEDLVSDMKLIIEDGGMPNWQEFVAVAATEDRDSQARKNYEFIRSMAANLDIMGDDWDAFLHDGAFETYAEGSGLNAYEALEALGEQLENTENRQKFESLLKANATGDMKKDFRGHWQDQSHEKLTFLIKQFGILFVGERRSRRGGHHENNLNEESHQPPDELDGETRNEEEKYFDREAMRPALEAFYKLSEEKRNESGIDINMLFYFLEGDGKIDSEWPAKIHDGRVITKEEYLAEAKKLESFIGEKQKSDTNGEAEELKELKSRDNFTVKSGDIVMHVELASPHPTIPGAWNTTMNIRDSKSGRGGNQVFMEKDIRALMNGAKMDINSVDEISKRPYPSLIHAVESSK